MCQKKRIKCFDNSLKIIRNIDNLHLVGLQEVNTDNLEKKIPNLTVLAEIMYFLIYFLVA